MKSENKTQTWNHTNPQSRDWGLPEREELVGEMSEGGQKVDTSSYKINAMGM